MTLSRLTVLCQAASFVFVVEIAEKLAGTSQMMLSDIFRDKCHSLIYNLYNMTPCCQYGHLPTRVDCKDSLILLGVRVLAVSIPLLVSHLRLRSAGLVGDERGELNMSIAAMVDTSLARREGANAQEVSPAKPVGVPTNWANQIVRWIPTETITVYVALLALVAPEVAHKTSFTSRWTLFWIMVAINPVVVLLLAMAKSKTWTHVQPPIFEMIIAPIAFAAWAFALPDTPLNSISGYSIKWNAAIITVTTVAITLVANAFHQSPDFDQVQTKQQGANPASPEQ